MIDIDDNEMAVDIGAKDSANESSCDPRGVSRSSHQCVNASNETNTTGKFIGQLQYTIACKGTSTEFP